MLGVLMALWSVTIMPIICRFSASIGDDFLPAGYFDIKTMFFSLRFDWKCIRNEAGISFKLRYVGRKQAHEHDMRELNQMGPQFKVILRDAPFLQKNLLGYLRNLYVKADICIGLSDAAATALTCGTISAVLAALPHVRAHVTPDFRSENICVNAACIASFRLGKLLLSAALYLHASIMQRVRQKAGGNAHGKSASD